MAISKSIALEVLIVLALFAILPTPVESCTCMPKHPQEHFCRSEFVIIARILRKSARKIDHNDVYKIEIKKAGKMMTKAEFYLKHGRLSTPSSDSMCGVNLKPGKLYIIAGREKHIRLCDYVEEYTKMSIVERRGFAGAYEKGCECQIKPCFGGPCPLPEGTCNWYPSATCERKYSACFPIRKTNNLEKKPTKCHWRRTPPYKECLHQ